MINVKFEVIDLENQLDILKAFLKRGGKTADYIAKHTGLDFSGDIDAEIERIYHQNFDIMQKKCVEFQKAWDEKRDFINQEFTKIFGEEFNFDCVSRVNLNPISPRFLDEKTFDMDFKQDNNEMLKTSAHEIVHFAWFEVLARAFPEIPRTHYESPNLVWLVSEIAVEPIFRFSKLHTLSSTLPAYSQFYEDKIDGKTVAENANLIFEQSENIKDFQKNILEFFQKHNYSY